jgi:hypothetical protein
MPTPTYKALATVTLGSSASSVTFSSIPGTYSDLVLVTNLQSSANTYCRIYLNTDEVSSNYSRVVAFFEGSVGSVSQTNSDTGVTSTSNFESNIWQIMDYSAINKHKTILGRQGSAARNFVYMDAIRWANTSAVTTVKLAIATGTFSTGSTFSIYGIAG